MSQNGFFRNKNSQGVPPQPAPSPRPGSDAKVYSTLDELLNDWYKAKAAFSVEGLGVTRQLVAISKAKKKIFGLFEQCKARQAQEGGALSKELTELKDYLRRDGYITCINCRHNDGVRIEGSCEHCDDFISWAPTIT